MKIGGPTADLRTRLPTARGSDYVLGRELSGGGMSRVFIAQDVRLGRTIVVKVTAPACSTRARWWALIECVNKRAAVHHDGPNAMTQLAASPGLRRWESSARG